MSTEAPAQPAVVLTGTETVLLVEDDDLVRELVAIILTQQGYTVLKAAQALQGLEMCRTYPDQIHLVLTDLLMPGGMDGRQLVSEAIRIRPGMRPLLMSGYTTDSLVFYGVSEGAPFLQKPFSIEQLASKVRKVLESGDAMPTEGFVLGPSR